MRNETLQDLIEAHGMGMEEVAAAAGLGRTTIWRWCYGHARPMRPHAAALASTLGVSTDRVLAAAGRSTARSAAPA